MNKECRDEITLVKTDSLLDLLENYLYKHRYKFYIKCFVDFFELIDFVRNVNLKF